MGLKQLLLHKYKVELIYKEVLLGRAMDVQSYELTLLEMSKHS